MLSPDSFCHLHLHTERGSMLDGLCNLDDLAELAAKCGHRAVAVTEHGNVHAAVAFEKACRTHDLKPIQGCEFYLADSTAPGSYKIRQQTEAMKKARKKYCHLTVLAQNYKGWQNLSKLASLASLEGFYHKPRIDLDLLRQHNEGLIVLSGCLSGPISFHLLRGDYTAARNLAAEYKEALGDRYYGEIQHNSLDEQKIVNEGWRQLAKDLDIQLVASADVHYLKKEDAFAQDIRICIASGKTVDTEKRLQMKPEFWYKTTEEMFNFFSQSPEVLTRTRQIADRCETYTLLSNGKFYFPKSILLDSNFTSTRDYLHHTALTGLKAKYTDLATILPRFDYEFGVIEKLGFVDYFLIVSDMLNWARLHGIPVGPGRGSACGSIVSYGLGITDIDPIRHKLIFERFINPGRTKSLPDIDIDICERNRWKVIEYLKHKYGHESVGQIATFMTTKPRSAIKDVGRVLGTSIQQTERLANMIPEEPNITFAKAFEFNPELANAVKEKGNDILFEYAQKFEGITRNTSIHAAGVVISDVPLMQRIPLMQPRGTSATVTQFSMEEVEQVGLLKIDLLGLKALTVIKDCIDHIKDTQGVRLRERDIPLDDPRTFALLQSGRTMGVFQLESEGMRGVLKQLKPDCIDDVMALVALYRPGPMGLIDTYLQRKHGKEPVIYDHPLLEEILRDTYGIIIYQESVQIIAHKLAGFSLAEADDIRKAIGKKKKELMDSQKEKFISGCQKLNKLSIELATSIWEKIETFASYSFNASHAAAYGYVAYRTAYLKANYPAEYMAAYLTSIRGNTDKLPLFLKEAEDLGITIIPPDINISPALFDVEIDEDSNKTSIYYGLEGIRECAETAVQEILQTREREGSFYSLFHFCEKVDLTKVNKSVIEKLVQVGAFDSLGGSRGQVMLCLEGAIKYGKEAKSKKNNIFLIKLSQEECQKRDLEYVLNKTSYFHESFLEELALGFNFFRSVFKEEDLLMKRVITSKIADLLSKVKSTQIISGKISRLRIKADKRGNAMGFFDLTDDTSSIFCLAFASAWENIRNEIEEEDIVFVEGEVDYGRENGLIFKVFKAGKLDSVKKGRIFQSFIDIGLTSTDFSEEWLNQAKNALVEYQDPEAHLRVMGHIFNEDSGMVQQTFNLPDIPDKARQKLLQLLPKKHIMKIGVAAPQEKKIDAKSEGIIHG